MGYRMPQSEQQGVAARTEKIIYRRRLFAFSMSDIKGRTGAVHDDCYSVEKVTN
jgi:hypothetical protein